MAKHLSPDLTLGNSSDFFTCRCTPELQAKYAAAAARGEILVHRVPVDCWTPEMQDRYERRVWVVYWLGDDHREARNDGPVEVYRSYADAMRYALAAAQEEADERDEVIVPSQEGFCVGYSVIGVKQLYIIPESVTDSD